MNLNLESLIILLIVAALVGIVGQKIAGSSRGGLLTAIALGFIGALIGTALQRQFKWPEIYTLHLGNTSFPVIWAIIGAALFVALLSLLTRRRYI
ncbi:MAG TPA: GlsB/YeaQ/YmgE family stress response membrane protein [Blastocatellia bacterium]|nr:GlsB/YeaQ/YmgE family stress response membrane protein [Blastocatellia bacterium]